MSTPIVRGARVLDLGCGRAALLVHHLRAQGLDAHGIDKIHGDGWLTYDFGHRRRDACGGPPVDHPASSPAPTYSKP